MKPEQQRIKIAEACGLTICGGCLCSIDEACCGCGSPIDGHSIYDGHSPVPMGCRCGYDKQPQPKWGSVPDYLNDLNAMHEAEKVLTTAQRNRYLRILGTKVAAHHNTEFAAALWNGTNATAAQRAEAFLRTLNLWEELQ